VHFPNIVLTVRREGGHLSLQQNNDEPRHELVPENAVDFFSTNSNDECTFATDGSKLTLHLGGQDIAVPRIR